MATTYETNIAMIPRSQVKKKKNQRKRGADRKKKKNL